MAEYIYKADITIDLPRSRVFEFFSDARNLEKITPPELSFHIITPTPIEMKTGALIDYKLRIRGIPVTWRTELTKWDPPFEFIDTQLRGPYKQWIHRHTFMERGNQTLMEDEVRYRLPFEPLGDLANFFVRKDIANIFSYREKVIREFLEKT